MFELEGDLGAFLGQAAVFEGVGKLVGLADAQQKLRLRDELLRGQAVLFRGGGERGEVDVGGDVLLAGSFVGVGADRVLAPMAGWWIGYQRIG